ncbi:hypothetical protein TCAL_10925 [Tigriopus californicus]|uniref:5'-AMP-activated protein kinase subunit beta-1 n=1 Tax=Tigriopus californicus TaxID=6832 RepID=A0A553N706_TIGCA|nr:5'-AMP-activated protein kinase subunit beta-1-like [Tigriopus californicus]XP_059088562.1 5'-AMP-activated protein kinase subunit beta-1-like [Tigriopus californicus]TRY61218.1 hypothetical protein TCAL_10925 [Tigriopus californicus]|eukprot:TCALIF_10925-PA protein Name:"Similar to PRKAB1 5'-AMP-activated protein kinase subunit beta-1 (Homo sapiens)" AED:0.02 eAED:0.02 QI:613/1/1/1/0.66/0.75/4/163/322
MGNANSNDRRKSHDAGTSFTAHELFKSTRANQGKSFEDPLNGPVAITAGRRDELQGHSIHNKASSRLNGHRPRATTEGGRQRYRQASVGEGGKYGEHKGFTNEEIQEEIRLGNVGTGKKRMPTIIKYNNNNAKEVYLCGTFNNWKRLPMSRSTKDFTAIVDLQEGNYEYKFWVDGKWVNDAEVEKVEHDEGEVNNVIRVRKEDFNAYDALDMDSYTVDQMSRKKKRYPVSEEYGQEPPTLQLLETRTGPPILPPHLLQVILNKDTPLSCEPTLLPEPNHVMLNHLYALSIKDGVMVLSSTQRFKKKYVTTLLYKPMGPRKTD